MGRKALIDNDSLFEKISDAFRADGYEGASLARLEARIVCEELLARTTSLEIAPGSVPVYSPSIFVRRLESLPLAAS